MKGVVGVLVALESAWGVQKRGQGAVREGQGRAVTEGKSRPQRHGSSKSNSREV